LNTFENHILVKDLVLPEHVKVLAKPDEIVVSVAQPAKVEEELAKEIEEKVEDVEKVEKKEKKEDVVEDEVVEEGGGSILLLCFRALSSYQSQSCSWLRDAFKQHLPPCTPRTQNLRRSSRSSQLLPTSLVLARPTRPRTRGDPGCGILYIVAVATRSNFPPSTREHLF
jgi:hypothetical protein